RRTNHHPARRPTLANPPIPVKGALWMIHTRRVVTSLASSSGRWGAIDQELSTLRAGYRLILVHIALDCPAWKRLFQIVDCRSILRMHHHEQRACGVIFVGRALVRRDLGEHFLTRDQSIRPAQIARDRAQN